MQNTYLYELSRVKSTQVQMVNSRGYFIPDNEKVFLQDLDYQHGIELIKNMYANVAYQHGVPINSMMSQRYYRSQVIADKTYNDSIIVSYLPIPKSGKAPGKEDLKNIISQFLSIVNSGEKVGLIIISGVKLNNPVTNDLKEKGLIYNIELFYHSAILANPSKHFLCPKMKLLNKVERELFLAETKLNPEDLRDILTDDAMARYLGAIEGDIIEIKRDHVPINILDSDNVAWARVVNQEVLERRKKKSKKNELLTGKVNLN